MFKTIVDFAIEMVYFLVGVAILAASVHFSITEFFPSFKLSYLQTLIGVFIIGVLKIKASDLTTMANAERPITGFAFFFVQLYVAVLLAAITSVLRNFQ